MKVTFNYIFSILLVCFFVSFLYAGEEDYVSADEPNFDNVDVVVETDWGTSEKTEAVDVLVLFNNDKPTGLVLAKKRKKLSEVTLVEGVVVKLYDHETGKLLKTIRSKN